MEKPICKKQWGITIRLAVSLLLCVLTLGMKHWYPQAAQTLRPWIIGRENNQVVQAFSALGASIEQGDNIGQAVQAFCGEMSGHGRS